MLRSLHFCLRHSIILSLTTTNSTTRLLCTPSLGLHREGVIFLFAFQYFGFFFYVQMPFQRFITLGEAPNLFTYQICRFSLVQGKIFSKFQITLLWSTYC